jgi:hypothetical protein
LRIFFSFIFEREGGREGWFEGGGKKGTDFEIYRKVKSFGMALRI